LISNLPPYIPYFQHSLLVTVGNVQLEPPAPAIVLEEKSDFSPSHRETFVIPDQPSVLGFDYDISFDTTDPDSINDAFEVALVDQTGQSLVHTIQREQDAFFNLTEGENVALAPSVSNSNSRVTLDLSGIEPGTSANLIFRLVNNDGDTSTEVRIDSIEVLPGTDEASSTFVVERETDNPSVDFSALEDVSSSLRAEYGRTSFNESSNALHLDIEFVNGESYEVRDTLLAAIDGISDPSVRVRDFDGLTPDGLPYFDLSYLIDDGILSAGERTGTGTITFTNPESVQFDYELVFLGKLNRAPSFVSEPDEEVVAGRDYHYPAAAVDPDEDELSYSLLVGPDGLEIDGTTGEVVWMPSTAGNYAVTLLVEDSRGERDTQTYTLQVVENVPNRPPVFISTPVVDATVNGVYSYAAVAVDADGDELSYGLLSGPEGLIVDGDTGEVSWTPGAGQLGLNSVTLLVEDGRGGRTEQSFEILTGSQRNNHAPLILSSPQTEAIVNLQYTYQLNAIDPDGDALSYSLIWAPTGMSIDPVNGLLTWEPTSSDLQEQLVIVEVQDDQGGKETQSWIVDVKDRATGVVTGRVYSREYLSLDEELSVTAKVTADNHYGLYYGSPENLNFVGRNEFGFYGNPGAFNWSLPETFPFTVNPNDYLYVVAWDDESGQMWLGEFELPNGVYLRTNKEDWLSVVASGRNPGRTGNVPSPEELKEEILAASWSNPQQSLPNNSTAPWRKIPGISSMSEFIWHDSFLSSATDPYYTIYRSAAPMGSYSASFFEEGLAEQIVYLDENENGRRDVSETYTQTDANGYYSFTLTSGNYNIAFEPQSGWLQLSPESKTYEVTVVDNETLENLDFVAIEGTGNPEDNNPPVLASLPSFSGEVGKQLLYQPLLEDDQGDTQIWDLVVAPDGMVVDGLNGLLSWRPQPNQVGVHDAILRVRDQFGATDIESFQITIEPANQPPIITSKPPEIAATINLPFEYQFKAFDPESEDITFALVGSDFNATIEPETGLFSWTPTTLTSEFTNSGAFPFIVNAVDERGDESSLYFELPVVSQSNAPDNSAPVIHSSPPAEIALGSFYLYQLVVSDPNNDPLTSQIVSGPEGMIIDSNKRVIWTPTPEQFGSNEVVLQVDDSRGGVVQQSFTLEVVAQSRNSSPQITSTPNSVNAVVGREYAYNATALDTDGDLVLWNLEDAPFGMLVDPQLGTVRWNPTIEQIGTHEVTLLAVDSQGAFTAQVFEVTVRGTNLPPAISSTPPTLGAVDKLYSYSVLASDPEGDALSWRLLDAPQGTIIDPHTGLIEWTPSEEQVGSFQVTVETADSLGATATQTYTLQIKEIAANLAPAITSTPSFTWYTGSEYSYRVTAFDPEGDALTFQLLEAPEGTVIDGSTGELVWTEPLTGTHPIVVGVNDGQLGAAQRFDLTIVENQAPAFAANSSPVTSVTLGEIYAYDIVAFDPNGTELVYTVDGPDGISIDRLGRLRWTPESSGVYPVTVIVSDGLESIEQSFAISVLEDTTAPSVRVDAFGVYLVGDEFQADIGEEITFQVLGSDNVGISSLQLEVDGVAVPLDRNGFAKITVDEVRTVTATAVGLDAAGNGATAALSVRVLDFSDTDAPQLTVEFPDTPVTNPIELVGTVTDSNLDYYLLEVAPLEGGEYVEVFRGTGEVIESSLGVLDPTVLANGAYQARLTAVDLGNNQARVEETIYVEGDLKLGNFQLSFTDLTIPVPGIPVTVTRTYDSLTANQQDNFGFGWRLEFRDTNLRTSVGKDENFEIFDITSKGFREGDKVYLTLPGGERETYVFKPRLTPVGAMLQALGSASGLATEQDFGLYEPAFVSQSDSNNQLEVATATLIRSTTGEFTGIAGGLYNPAANYYGGRYTLTTDSGIVYDIDAESGDLLTARDTNGNELNFSDAGITSDSGVEVRFGRDAQGRITRVIDPEGNEIGYEYDGNGDLVGVTDREGNRTGFGYSEVRAHYLDEIIDPLNRPAVKTEYDENGRLKKIIDTDGDPIEFIYDPDNNIQTTKDAFGNPTIHEYDPKGNVIREINALGHETRLEYDNNNNVTKVIDSNNNIISYTYDDRGNVLSRTAPHSPDNSNPEITRYTYNKFNQNTAVILPTGAVFNQNYDGRGNLLSMTDGEGNIIQAFTYDYRGNVTSETDPTGTSYYSDFDAFGNARRVEDSFGEVITSTYDKEGRITSFTDDEGTSTFEYDKSGREIRADYGDGIYVEYGYEGAGGDWTVLDAPTIGHLERRFTDDGKLGGWLTPGGEELTFTYDEAGRLKTEVTPDGTTTYEYDKLGRVKRITNSNTDLITEMHYDQLVGDDPDPDVADNLIGQLAARTVIVDENTSYTTSYTYHPDGKTKSMTDANGNTWFYEYTTTSTTVIDPLGRRTTSVQTDQYLPSQTINPDGSSSRVEYLYSNNLLEGSDYPTRIIDRGGNDRHFGYDELGRLISATDLGDTSYSYIYGDNGLASVQSPTVRNILSYTYNDSGEVTRITYSDGGVKEYSYNEENELERVTLPTGVTVDYEYDSSGVEISRTNSLDGEVISTYDEENGQLLSVEDSTGTTNYIYDELSNEFLGIDYPNGSSLRYEYDDFGRISSVRVQADAVSEVYTTSYEYDAVGNLVKVIDPNSGETVMVYDALNRLTSRSLPNGVTSSYVYQENTDWIQKITHTATDGTVLASSEYIRGAAGEPIKIIREDGSYVEVVYDDSLRVVKETYFDSNDIEMDEIKYSYDADGNRLTVSGGSAEGTYIYDHIHQLIGITTATGDETYTYDAGGRIASITRDGSTWNLEYNSADLITRITDAEGNVIVEYEYDSSGRRVGATDSTASRDYLVAPMGNSDLESPHLVTDSNGDLISAYIYGGAMPLMRLDGSGNPVYYLTDAMGSVIGLADVSGIEVADFRYDSFGNLRSSTGVEGDREELAGGDFRFQGQWLSSRTDLYHFRARDYDPESGRFVSRDSVELIEYEPESSNPYQFVYNNPYVYSDPTGAVTLNELSIRNVIEDILNTIQQHAVQEVRERLTDEARGLVGKLVGNFISKMAPIDFDLYNQEIKSLTKDKKGDPGSVLESLVTYTVCHLIGASGTVLDYLWIEPRIDPSGNPQHDGFSCSRENRNESQKINKNIPDPDFLVSKHAPTTTEKLGTQKSWLIGDFKINVNKAGSFVNNHKDQWKAMKNYALERQYIPLTMYVTFYQAKYGQDQINKIRGEALKQKVLLYIVPLTNIKK